MEFINSFLLELSPPVRNTLYSAFGYGMYAAFVAIFLWSVKKRGITRKPAILILVSFVLAFLLGQQITVVLKNVTGGLIPDRNLGVAMLTFLPVFCILLLLFRLPVTTGLDAAIPMYIGGRGFCIIGCIFPGCCHGAAAEWGLFSHSAKYNTVPCPLIDSLVSLLIVGFLMGRKKGRTGEGFTAAYGLIAFGILRYVIDLLRDNDKILNLVTSEGIFGFLYVCIGLVMLYLLQHRSKEVAAADTP